MIWRLKFELDIQILNEIWTSRYLHGWSPVLKLGNIHLAWEYAQNPCDHEHFVNMLWVSPQVFDVILYFIHNHTIFQNNSNNPQAPIPTQLAVTLYRMGWYGNGASTEDLARVSGISEGSVINYTEWCLKAIESFHDIFVWPLTPEEKEREKCWWMSIFSLWLVGEKGGSCTMGQLLCYMLVQTCMVVYTTLERGTMGWTARWAKDITLFHVIQHSISNSRLEMCPLIFVLLTTPMAWLVQHMMQQHSSILGLQSILTGYLKETSWPGQILHTLSITYHTIPVHRQPASFDPKNALFNKVWSSYSLRTLCESTQGMIPMSSWPSSDYQQQLEPCRCWSVDHCCNHTAKSYHWCGGAWAHRNVSWQAWCTGGGRGSWTTSSSIVWSGEWGC